MPRPRKDKTTGKLRPARPPNRKNLTPLLVSKLRPRATAFLVWDETQVGLALQVQPSGHRAWKVIYRFHSRPRWLHIGDARAIGLAAARELAAEHMLAVIKGGDPAANKQAERFRGTFKELSEKYVADYAAAANKSWKQAAALVEKHLLPRWASLPPADISRSDAKAVLKRIESPAVRNQVLASGSAIFSWAIKEEIGGVRDNPFKLISSAKRESRERVLSEAEIPKFWAAFTDAGLPGIALKLILLTGQRPGEILHMRREHFVDGWWWQMPGQPVREQQWPGTKNGQAHRVWIPALAQRLIEELDGEGFVLTRAPGRMLSPLDADMRIICQKLGVDRATPHDLRRTHGSTITRLGFGRDAMNRIQNHKEGGIADVYDRHQYESENKRLMEAVAAHIIALVQGRPGGNKVVPYRTKPHHGLVAGKIGE